MYHIIVNPVAGKQKTVRAAKETRDILTGAQKDCVVLETSSVKELSSALKNLSAPRSDGKRNDLIAVGGDGTLHALLNAIEDVSAVNVGLIPCGTGNDFAEYVGLSSDVRQATDVILNGTAKDTDYLEVGGVRCMNVGGLGIDTDVLRRYNKSDKVHGKLKYLRCLIQSLLHFKGNDIVVENDGEKIEHKAFIAAACNGGRIGGGIKICPAAVADDGKLDVCVVDMVRGFKMIGAFFKLMRGKILEFGKTTHYLCERVRFFVEGGATVQLDGELYENLDFDARIGKGLKFYRP